jgi:hypothetical protein
MIGEINQILGIVVLVLGGIVSIFVAGRWFGWKHKEIIEKILQVHTVLETHIKDENVIFERIEGKLTDHKEDIKRLERIVINGGGERHENRTRP